MRYYDVKRDAAAMRRFLELGGGDRQVPLIREVAEGPAPGRVCVGHGGT